VRGGRSLYSPPVSDLPIDLPTSLAERLGPAFDTEGKIARALNDIGQLAGREVGIIDGAGRIGRQLSDLGARVSTLNWSARSEAPPDSVDALVSPWTGFQGVDPAEIADAERILRPGGRLLVIHDYGRDDVSRLLGDRPQYGSWSRLNGPFLSSGFRIRVVHCWWTFPTLEAAAAFVTDAFGSAGAEVAAALRRPRLSYNVALYHRTRT
jgi:hypothetical protein